MEPRKNLNDGFLNSKWAWYGVARTGVAFPNCVTYATSRISEILDYYQPLDEPDRVRGAQELIEKHSKEFVYSSEPVPGALMVWGYGEYGHVAVCEEVFDIATVSWSQSNYGGPMFEYETGNPYSFYPWMTFRGYLVHEDLLKNKKKEATMYCIFKIIETGKEYYFDGVKAHEITNPDEKVILQEIYKANNGKDMPYREWSTKAPWYYRLCKPGEKEVKF